MSSFQSTAAKERSILSELRQMFYAKKLELLRANWIKMKHACGRSYCRCATSKKYRHVSWYVSQSKNGKSRMKSVPKEHRKIVTQWIQRYQHARTLLQRIGDLYWDRVGSGKKR